VHKPFIALLMVLILAGYVSRAMAQTEVNPSAEGGGGQTPQKSEEVILLEKGGVLLPQGTVVVEPGFQYTHFSKNVLSLSGYTLFGAIHIGTIKVEDLERDIVIPSLTLRFGIFDSLEFAVKAPWFYRRDKFNWTDQGEVEEFIVSDDGLGDIEGSLYWQLVKGRGAIPDIVFNLKAKSNTGRDPYGLKTKEVEGRGTALAELPTGTGHWGLNGGFTLVKAADPAVLFGSVGYFYNFERDVEDFGEIDPGDSIEYSLGIAYALNEKLSTSLSFQHRLTFETKQDGKKILGSDVNVMLIYFGVSYSPTPKTSINVSVGSGLTMDSPSVDINLSVPISFSLL
jgi:hypothetical protein